MDWKKRDDSCNTIKDVVLKNSGKSEKEFFAKKEYYIQHLIDVVAVIKRAISQKKRITVVGDYDVDGICSATILKLMLVEAGAQDIVIRLPKRFSEGYGLSGKIIDEINSGLLITVDNGITAVDEIQKAKDKGIEVIVIDHHLRREDDRIPCADIVIDPNAIENSATFNGYCGAGLSYKLAVEMLGEGSKMIPKMLSLAAIATVADVMYLTDENRNIVKSGLESMVTYAGRTTGLGALLMSCDMDKALTAKDIAFKIAPILNAPGRLIDDGATQSYELLSYNGYLDKAKEMAEALSELNEKRKELKEEGLELLEANMVNNCLFGDCPLVIYEPGLQEGLVGIFAGSLAEKYKTPCFVFTDSEDKNILKGSARTYGKINLKQLLDANSDKLYKYGGHAEAAGVSVEREKFSDMVNGFFETIEPPETNDDNIMFYDLEIDESQINDAFNEMQEFGPYGNGNPEIVFAINNYTLSPGGQNYYRTMGKKANHIKLFGKTSVAIAFDMTETYHKMGDPKSVSIIGTISINYFRGKPTIQIEVNDMKPVKRCAKRTLFAEKLSQKASERY